MLDWPDPIQTSPTYTSATVTVDDPVTVMENGPPASWAGRRTVHFPSAPVVPVACCVPSFTVTLVLAVSVPQTGTSILRCTTM